MQEMIESKGVLKVYGIIVFIFLLSNGVVDANEVSMTAEGSHMDEPRKTIETSASLVTAMPPEPTAANHTNATANDPLDEENSANFSNHTKDILDAFSPLVTAPPTTSTSSITNYLSPCNGTFAKVDELTLITDDEDGNKKNIFSMTTAETLINTCGYGEREPSNGNNRLLSGTTSSDNNHRKDINEHFYSNNNRALSSTSMLEPTTNSGNNSNNVINTNNQSGGNAPISAGHWFKVIGTGDPLLASICNQFTVSDTYISLFRSSLSSSLSVFDDDEDVEDCSKDLICIRNNNDMVTDRSRSSSFMPPCSIMWESDFNVMYYIFVYRTGELEQEQQQQFANIDKNNNGQETTTLFAISLQTTLSTIDTTKEVPITTFFLPSQSPTPEDSNISNNLDKQSSEPLEQQQGNASDSNLNMTNITATNDSHEDDRNMTNATNTTNNSHEKDMIVINIQISRAKVFGVMLVIIAGCICFFGGFYATYVILGRHDSKVKQRRKEEQEKDDNFTFNSRDLKAMHCQLSRSNTNDSNNSDQFYDETASVQKIYFRYNPNH